MVNELLLEEIDRGEGMPLSQLAQRVPRVRLGKPVSLSCVLRWVLDGAKVQGQNGRRVKLEAVRLGGKWISTPGALRRFILAQTPGDQPPPTMRTAGQRTRATEKATRELEQAGI
jgi:hypothetical protein